MKTLLLSIFFSFICTITFSQGWYLSEVYNQDSSKYGVTIDTSLVHPDSGVVWWNCDPVSQTSMYKVPIQLGDTIWFDNIGRINILCDGYFGDQIQLLSQNIIHHGIHDPVFKVNVQVTGNDVSIAFTHNGEKVSLLVSTMYSIVDQRTYTNAGATETTKHWNKTLAAGSYNVFFTVWNSQYCKNYYIVRDFFVVF